MHFIPGGILLEPEKYTKNDEVLEKSLNVMRNVQADLLERIKGATGEDIDRIQAEYYIEIMDKHRVDKGGILFGFGTSRDMELIKLGNDTIAKIVDMFPDRFIGLLTINPEAQDARRELFRGISELSLKGVKLDPTAGNFNLEGEKAIRIVHQLSTLGLPMLIDTAPLILYRKCLEQVMSFYSDPVKVLYLKKQVPRAKIIAAHFGGGLPIFKGMTHRTIKGDDDQDELISSLYYDTSSIISETLVVGLVRMGFGDKLIFGTDFPFISKRNYSRILAIIRENSLLTPEEQDRILATNFINLFGEGIALEEVPRLGPVRATVEVQEEVIESENVDKLLSLVKSDSETRGGSYEDAKDIIADMITSLESKEAEISVEPLLNLLDSDDKEVRRKAMYSLVKIGEGNMGALLSFLKNPDKKQGKFPIVYILARLKTPESLNALIEVVKEGPEATTESLFRYAISELVKLGDARFLNPVKQIANDPNTSKQLAAQLREIIRWFT